MPQVLTPWQQHIQRWSSCERCNLQHCRSRVVLARGQLPCDVLLIGEAPGESEDAIGEPFVGPAGKLLDSIVAASLPPKTRCCFTNVVACIPRDEEWQKVSKPDPAELAACLPRLKELVKMARPKLVVLVGVEAAKWVNVQGSALGLTGTPSVEIHHPAYVLRLPDVQRGMAAKRCVIQMGQAWQAINQAIGV